MTNCIINYSLKRRSSIFGFFFAVFNNPINFVSSNITPLRQDIDDVNSILNKYGELESSDNIPEKLKEIEKLNAASDEFAARRMDTHVRRALRGHGVNEFDVDD